MTKKSVPVRIRMRGRGGQNEVICTIFSILPAGGPALPATKKGAITCKNLAEHAYRNAYWNALTCDVPDVPDVPVTFDFLVRNWVIARATGGKESNKSNKYKSLPEHGTF